MKMLTSVVWSEGMYLGPHHFQAQNRYFEDSMRFAIESLSYAAFGFTGFEVDADALQQGTLSVLRARGVFRDGMTFDMPGCDPVPEPRRITELFPATHNSMIASLAVPRRTSSGQNCAIDAAADGSARFVGAVTPVWDENTGRDEKPVRLGRKNVRLLFDTEAHEQFEVLPIARIKRDAGGHFVADANFIPPCLRLTASESLMLLLRRLIDMLEEKSATLLKARGSGKFQAGMSSSEVSSFWFLHSINAALGPLRHIYHTKRGHPEELFRELSRVGGALCTFGLESHPSQLPAYDHEDLDKCFHELDEHIRRHLEIMIPSQAIRIPLKAVSRYFYEGEIADTRVLGPSRWIIGLHSSIGDAELMQKAPAVVKICSAKFVPELVKRALPGLKLLHMPVPPPQVPARIDFQYFSLNRTGPCWEHMVQTRQVGVYVPGDIPNADLEILVVTES